MGAQDLRAAPQSDINRIAGPISNHQAQMYQQRDLPCPHLSGSSKALPVMHGDE